MVLEEVVTQGFIWFPVIPLTIVLGIIQLIFIHKDEPFRGSHWFTHGVHILLVMPLFLLAVFNTEYFLDLTGLRDVAFIGNVWVIRVIIGLIFGIKSYAISSVIKGGAGTRGMHEGFLHVLIMMALVTTAPLYWPVVEPLLPEWARSYTSTGG